MRKLDDSVLLSLALVRSVGAALNHIDDCDEVFNYWEPLHYLLYGSGMQTWEYAPQYALRTYAYLAPFVIVGKVLAFCGVDKLGVFFGIRMALALCSAAMETLFVQAIRQKFSKYVTVCVLLSYHKLFLVVILSITPRETGDYTFWFLILAPGVFTSSTALLPSSFCGYCVLAAYTAWFLDKSYTTVHTSGFYTST